MKRNRSHNMPKRTTFLKLFLKAVCVSLVCTLIFAGIFRRLFSNMIKDDISRYMTDTSREITTYLSKNETTGRPIGVLSAYMSMYTRYYVIFSELPSFMMNDPDLYEIVSDSGDPENFAMSAIVDSKGNTLADSRGKFTAQFLFSEAENTDNGSYYCAPLRSDIPEAEKLYEKYFELSGKVDENTYRDVSLNMESAYVDKETRTFVPHEADILIETYDFSGPADESIVNEGDHISIELDDDNYELVTFRKNEISKVPDDEIYPRTTLCHYCGTAWESFDGNAEKISAGVNDDDTGLEGQNGDMDDFECGMRTPVYINGEQCVLNMYYHFSAKGTVAETYYRLVIVIFAVLSLLLALLWAWQKNVRNKARYAFEDYQRDLTDHLAHDIKTPLMAISGYAENVLKGKLSETEKTEYLNSILDNVSFTDQLISRTLYLNHMGGKITSKEAIQLNDTVEDIIGKYTLLLHEKKIVYSVSGNAEISADRTAMETVIENLISNAVKYTPNEGTLRIVIDKKHMTVSNTVSEKIDTKELTRPFFRGDAARSNADGNGLGLAIAERTALANGFKLSISCTDTEFRAEIRF